MAFRFHFTIATMLVAALGWGLFIKAYLSRSAWRERALQVAELTPACVAPIAEPAPACVAPDQLLNFNLGQVNDIRINLQVGVQKLTDVMTSIQEKSRELSGLEAQHGNLMADVTLLNEQIQAKCIALAQLPAPTAETQPLTPPRGCP